MKAEKRKTHHVSDDCGHKASFSKRKRRPPNQSNSKMKLTVVIPTLGRAKHIARCLDDIEQMDTHGIEVIIIDQGALKDRIELDRLPLSARVFRLEIPNASLARNIGLCEARGEIVLFLDDDVRIPNKSFLQNHLMHYVDPGVAGVYGQVLEVDQPSTNSPKPEIIEQDWGWMVLPANYNQRCLTRNGGSGNLSVRRDWAIEVGGMDAWFEKGARREETEFNLRYTKRYGPLVFDPNAGLIHLSASGGSRTWGRVRRTVPMHHIIGHWYFFLRALNDQTLGRYGMALELRHIAIALVKNPQVGRNPFLFFLNSVRALWGLTAALSRLFRGARRIETTNTADYREITLRTDPQ